MPVAMAGGVDVSAVRRVGEEAPVQGAVQQRLPRGGVARADREMDAPRLAIAEGALDPPALAGLEPLAFEPGLPCARGEDERQPRPVALGRKRVEDEPRATSAGERLLGGLRRELHGQSGKGPGGREGSRQQRHACGSHRRASSTRRFRARPSSVSLRSLGLDSPKPAVVRRAPAMVKRLVSAAFTAAARRAERSRLYWSLAMASVCPSTESFQSGFRLSTSAISRSVGSDSGRIRSLL